MQITVWTFTSDTDNGMLTSIHNTQDEAYMSFVETMFPDESRDAEGYAKAYKLHAEAVEDDNFGDLDEFLNDQRDILDTCSVEPHTLTVAAPGRVLNDRETNTILHALRSMEHNAKNGIDDSCAEACDHFGDAPPLMPGAIEALCESIGLNSLVLLNDDVRVDTPAPTVPTNLMDILDNTEEGKKTQRGLLETWFPYIGTNEQFSGSECIQRLNEWWEAVDGELEEEDEEEKMHECQNCQTMWDKSVLNPIKDIGQRVAPGEPMPSGECPDCGALCHPVETEESTDAE
jgi:hypothetical protein